MEKEAYRIRMRNLTSNKEVLMKPIMLSKEEADAMKISLGIMNNSVYGNNITPCYYTKIEKMDPEEYKLWEDKFLDNLEALIKMKSRSENYLYDYLYQEEPRKWFISSEFLIGTFAGRGFEEETKREALKQLKDYFDLNLKSCKEGMVGSILKEAGWPNLDKVYLYMFGKKIEENPSDVFPHKLNYDEY